MIKQTKESHVYNILKRSEGHKCPLEEGEITTETSWMRRRSHRESQGQALYARETANKCKGPEVEGTHHV